MADFVAFSRSRPPGSSRKAPELLAGAPRSGSTSPRLSSLICEGGHGRTGHPCVECETEAEPWVAPRAFRNAEKPIQWKEGKKERWETEAGEQNILYVGLHSLIIVGVVKPQNSMLIKEGQALCLASEW